MRVRDENVMALARDSVGTSTTQIAEVLYLACFEAQAEGLDPSSDPAVRLIGLLFSFRCGIDTIPYENYVDFMQQCQERMNEVPALQ